MNSGLKYTLITLGLLGTAVGIYFLVRPKDDKNSPADDILDELDKPSPSSSKYKSDSFPLKRNSGGSRVKATQRYLNKAKGESLTVDGKFGPKTEGAVKKHIDSGGQVTETFYNSNIKVYENENYNPTNSTYIPSIDFSKYVNTGNTLNLPNPSDSLNSMYTYDNLGNITDTVPDIMDYDFQQASGKTLWFDNLEVGY